MNKNLCYWGNLTFISTGPIQPLLYTELNTNFIFHTRRSVYQKLVHIKKRTLIILLETFFNNVSISWNIRKHYLLYFHINLSVQERELDNVCSSTSDVMSVDPLRPSKCITKQNPNDTICWPLTPRIVPTTECHAAYMTFVLVYWEFCPSGI